MCVMYGIFGSITILPSRKFPLKTLFHLTFQLSKGSRFETSIGGAVGLRYEVPIVHVPSSLGISNHHCIIPLSPINLMMCRSCFLECKLFHLVILSAKHSQAEQEPIKIKRMCEGVCRLMVKNAPGRFLSLPLPLDGLQAFWLSWLKY